MGKDAFSASIQHKRTLSANELRVRNLLGQSGGLWSVHVRLKRIHVDTMYVRPAQSLYLVHLRLWACVRFNEQLYVRYVWRTHTHKPIKDASTSRESTDSVCKSLAYRSSVYFHIFKALLHKRNSAFFPKPLYCLISCYVRFLKKS